jgi:hypothetical protein
MSLDTRDHVALQDYLHRVKSHPELFAVPVPIGNGEEVALKVRDSAV